MSVASAADYDFQFRLVALRPMVVSTQPGAIMVSHPAAESTMVRKRLTWARWKQSARLRSKLRENQEIPQAARQYVLSVLNGRLSDALFRTYWLKAVMDGHWKLADRAVVVYRVTGHRSKARGLAAAQRIIRAIPLARRAVRLIYRAFVFLRETKSRQARRNLTNFAPYLEI
jgi:hypothetical protein